MLPKKDKCACRLYFIYVHIAWLQVGQLALHVHVAKTNSILLRSHRKSTPVITESLQINKFLFLMSSVLISSVFRLVNFFRGRTHAFSSQTVY